MRYCLAVGMVLSGLGLAFRSRSPTAPAGRQRQRPGLDRGPLREAPANCDRVGGAPGRTRPGGSAPRRRRSARSLCGGSISSRPRWRRLRVVTDENLPGRGSRSHDGILADQAPALGFDFSRIEGKDAAGPGTGTMRVRSASACWTIPGRSRCCARSWRKDELARVLAEPTLTTISGRRAQFNSGGEFPIRIAGEDGSATVQYRHYGTLVDLVPTVIGDRTVRLAIRIQASELDTRGA